MAAAAALNNSGLWLPGVGNTKEDKIEKWWEVNRNHDPPLTRGATPLVERCMRTLGWTEIFAKRVLKGYRQFMELKSVMNDWQETKLSPPMAVQQMWEQHLLDNLNYTDDCFLLFGRVIGHDPDAVIYERATLDRVKTTKIAFQARYGGDLDPEVWDFGHSEMDLMAVDTDDHANPAMLPPSTPRGRLPVAGVDRHLPVASHVQQVAATMSLGAERGSMSMSPRTRSNAAYVVASDSDENNSPVQDRHHVALSAPRSPRQERTRSVSKGPRSPKSPSGNDPITIFLRDSNSGEETYFSLRYRSTLRIVFTVFAERKGLSQENLKFSFNGQSLTGYETPYSLGLEDRARIDVLIAQRRI